MKLVIDIDDKLYNRIKYLEPNADTMLDELMRSVQNGTPLPEPHGRLIDADALTEDIETLQNSFVINKDMTGKILGFECLVPTIIGRSDTE